MVVKLDRTRVENVPHDPSMVNERINLILPQKTEGRAPHIPRSRPMITGPVPWRIETNVQPHDSAFSKEAPQCHAVDRWPASEVEKLMAEQAAFRLRCKTERLISHDGHMLTTDEYQRYVKWSCCRESYGGVMPSALITEPGLEEWIGEQDAHDLAWK